MKHASKESNLLGHGSRVPRKGLEQVNHIMRWFVLAMFGGFKVVWGRELVIFAAPLQPLNSLPAEILHGSEEYSLV